MIVAEWNKFGIQKQRERQTHNAYPVFSQSLSYTLLFFFQSSLYGLFLTFTFQGGRLSEWDGGSQAFCLSESIIGEPLNCASGKKEMRKEAEVTVLSNKSM